MSTKLRSYYKETVIPALMEQFNYKNIHQVPKITKVTINRGIGEASRNNKVLETSVKELALIAGQQPVVTKARTSVAGFKIREGVPVGMAVTLRKDMMYSFLERLIRGNYNLGIKEQLMFPEIEYDKVDQIRGLDIAITTTAKTQQEGIALLKALGLPFNDN
jgi:large subunit ribosomal protein L5